MNSLYQLFVYTAMWAVLVPVVGGLTKECASVRTPCIVRQLQDQTYSEDPCTSGTRYVSCLAGVLQQASVRGVCGPVVLLSWLQDAYSEAVVYTQYCPNTAVPSSLRLDACQQELAACGSRILQAHVDQSRGSSSLCTGNVQLFTTCLSKDTGSCNNRSQVDILRRTELDQISCDLSTSLATVTSTTAAPAVKPSPPATTTGPRPSSPTSPPFSTPKPATAVVLTSPPTTTLGLATATVWQSPSTRLPSPASTASREFYDAQSTSSVPGLASAVSSSSSPAAKTTTAATSTMSPTPPLAVLITTSRVVSLVDNNPCTADKMRENGMFQSHPGDPTKFWQCTPWGRAFLFDCPQGTRWRQAYRTCVMR